MVWLRLKDPSLSISNSAGFNISGNMIVEAPPNLKLSPGIFYIFDTYEEAVASLSKSPEVLEKKTKSTKPAAEPASTPTLDRKYVDNLLAQNTRTILKSLREDQPSADDAQLLLEAERKGKNRSVIVNFLRKLAR